jgi:holo-[acyl-carrier protein] synthase
VIYGIGTDIVSIARMEQALARHGDHFAERILGEKEFEEFKHAAKPASFIAKRFAAKEATAKAMGLGFRNGLALKHICVVHDELGKPVLEFHEQGSRLVDELGIGEAFLSLADERDVAVAFVTLLKRIAIKTDN